MDALFLYLNFFLRYCNTSSTTKGGPPSPSGEGIYFPMREMILFLYFAKYTRRRVLKNISYITNATLSSTQKRILITVPSSSKNGMPRSFSIAKARSPTTALIYISFTSHQDHVGSFSI